MYQNRHHINTAHLTPELANTSTDESLDVSTRALSEIEFTVATGDKTGLLNDISGE
jgi:hypothetical protein